MLSATRNLAGFVGLALGNGLALHSQNRFFAGFHLEDAKRGDGSRKSIESMKAKLTYTSNGARETERRKRQMAKAAAKGRAA